MAEDTVSKPIRRLKSLDVSQDEINEAARKKRRRERKAVKDAKWAAATARVSKAASAGMALLHRLRDALLTLGRAIRSRLSPSRARAYPDGLQCFCLEGEEWIVAASIDDALLVYGEVMGRSWEEVYGNPLGDGWEVWEPSRTLAIVTDDEDGPPWQSRKVHTVGYWIHHKGRGLLAAANW